MSVMALPPRSPNLTAHAERFVLSIKSECLDRMVLLGEGHSAQRWRTTWSILAGSGAIKVSETD